MYPGHVEARARRAAGAVGLAAVVVAAIGVFHLRPWQVFAPATARPPSPRPVAPLVTLQQLQFLSGSLGWVVTGRPNSSALYRTTDSGRHWQHQLDGVGGLGWSLSFSDARRGVVSGMDQRGAAAWRTSDGGQHWTRSAMPCMYLPVLAAFVDLDHGWCVAPGPVFAPVGVNAARLPDRQQVTLYRTTDGGDHWSLVLATGPAQPVTAGLGDDGQKSWIWFRDADVGWIGQHSPSGHAVVYATTDGGDHWSREELPPPRGGWGPAQATFEVGPPEVAGQAAPSVVVAPLLPGPQPQVLLGAGQYVYTWQPGTWTGPVPIPNGAVLVDRARWLVTNGSSVLETTNAGESWHALGEVPAGWQVLRLAMADRDHGWALLVNRTPSATGPFAPAMLVRTADGGRHWTPVAAPPS